MAQEQQNSLTSPPMVALAQWLVPGAGYWLLGQRTRAIVVGVAIMLIFIFGILVSGIRVVSAPDMAGSAGVATKILNKPWFIGQIFMGPTAIASAWISDELSHSSYAKIESKARLAEIGTLYTAVAGMLNLLAIIDASHRATLRGGG